MIWIPNEECQGLEAYLWGLHATWLWHTHREAADSSSIGIHIVGGHSGCPSCKKTEMVKPKLKVFRPAILSYKVFHPSSLNDLQILSKTSLL